MTVVTTTELSPREHILLEHEKEEGRLAREHALNMKRLDIEAQKLEAQWSSWLKIPLTIIKLPVYILFGIGYICNVLTKQEPSENFWKLLK